MIIYIYEPYDIYETTKVITVKVTIDTEENLYSLNIEIEKTTDISIDHKQFRLDALYKAINRANKTAKEMLDANKT
jgi:hypothetical protein